MTLTPSAAGRVAADGLAAATAAMDLLPTALRAAKRDDDISAAAAKIEITTAVGECHVRQARFHFSGNMDEQLKSRGKWQQGVTIMRNVFQI